MEEKTLGEAHPQNPTNLWHEYLMAVDADHAAWFYTVLYQKSRDIVFHTALSVLKDPELAKDQTQEIFIYLWEKRNTPSFFQLKNYLAWLRRVTINHCFEYLRTQNKLELHLIEEEEIKIPQDFLVEEEYDSSYQAILLQGISTIKHEKYRQILTLQLENLSDKQIAQQLAIPQKRYRKTKHYAKKALKKALVSMGIRINEKKSNKH